MEKLSCIHTAPCKCREDLKKKKSCRKPLWVPLKCPKTFRVKQNTKLSHQILDEAEPYQRAEPAPAWNETLPCSGLQPRTSSQSSCTSRHSSAARTSNSSWEKGVEHLLAITSLWLERGKPLFKWTWNQQCQISSACAWFDAGVSVHSTNPGKSSVSSKHAKPEASSGTEHILALKTDYNPFLMQIWNSHWLVVLDCWCNHWVTEVGHGCSSTRSKKTPKHTPKCSENRKKQLLTGSNRRKSAFNHDFLVKVTVERLLL